MSIQYLIPKPSVENAVNTGYKGTLIYSETNYSRNYYVLQKDTENAWWAIGMIAKVGRYDHPIIVSDQRKNVHTICDGGGGQNTVEYEMTYDGVKYYVNGSTNYATDTESGSLLKNNIIPYYSESTFSGTEAGYKSAGKKLIDLYKAAGGTMPGEEPEPSPSHEYSKVEYNRINWENKSTSLKTPLNESNLNKMDKAIEELCRNLDIAHTESDVKKLDKTSANKLISETPTWDSDTGILTFKFFDGTSFSVDFNIEKIPVSFSMDSAGVITMETADGTRWTADISEAIPSAYTFSNGARITFTETTGEDGTKKITADLVKGSITDEYLATDFLAKITSNVNSASSSAASAASSATDAAADAKLAQSYAIGGSGIRDGEDTDNAKYYAQKSAENLDYAKNLVTSGDDITE